MNNDYALKSRINDDITKMMALKDPFECNSAIEFDVFVTKPDKMVEAYQNISKLK